MSARHEITAGFMPLLDSALLVAAKEKGFAEDEGVDLTLVRETSWANIRDRLAVGHFQVGAYAGADADRLQSWADPARRPHHRADGARTWRQCGDGLERALGRDGSAWRASRSRSGADRRRAEGRHRRAGAGRPCAAPLRRRPSPFGAQLRAALLARRLRHRSRPRHRDRHPAAAADGRCARRSGSIDGYCVGEPWNTAAVCTGLGHIATVKAAIWKGSPEKVLGAQAHWAEHNPEALAALLRALYRAALWCAEPANREELARAARRPDLYRPAGGLDDACAHRRDPHRRRRDGAPSRTSSCPSPRRRPSPGRATRSGSTRRWCAGVRCRHARANEAIARETYRPDLYRAALEPLGVALPGANAKVEGALKVRNAGRLGGRQPDARPRRFLRRRPVRSRPYRRLYRCSDREAVTRDRSITKQRARIYADR